MRTAALCAAAFVLLAGHSPAGGRQPVRSSGECVAAQAVDGDRRFVSDAAECAVPSTPASTFKIPHALIALDTGVIRPDTRMPWDGSAQPFPSWQRDHALESSIRSSVVWFYRRTAAQIGRGRMRERLAALDYAADRFERDVTAFWLDGDLAVTPLEQLAFMRRFARHELPVSPAHIDIVKSAMRMPEGTIENALGTHAFALAWPGPATVWAKTGNGAVDGVRVSWMVGLVEARGERYAFAGRVRGPGVTGSTSGADLVSRVLSARPPASW